MPRNFRKYKRRMHGGALKEDLLFKALMEVPGLAANFLRPIVSEAGNKISKFIKGEGMKRPPAITNVPVVRSYEGIYHVTDAGSNFTAPGNITRYANKYIRKGQIVGGSSQLPTTVKGGSSQLAGEVRPSRNYLKKKNIMMR